MTRTELKSVAKWHERTRCQHNDELAQDYVEAIYRRLVAGDPVRVMDLQGVFGVSHVSVIRALKRFEARDLLVRSDKRGGITLTAKGTQMAIEAAKRHELVVQFFRLLGVSESQSQADAEGIEHHISEETLCAMKRLIEERR